MGIDWDTPLPIETGFIRPVVGVIRGGASSCQLLGKLDSLRRFPSIGLSFMP